MKNRIAIVTGASGGLGKEFVRLMLKEDLDEIWVVARNAEKLNNLRKEYGSKIIIIPKDLSEHEGVISLGKLIENENPDIVYLINNAGIGKFGSYKDFSADESRRTIGLSCNAVAALCILCIPYMQAGSRIINVSSQASFQPVPYINLYAATRAFIRSYTRALNIELRETGITATAVCPGWVDTDLLMKENGGKKIKFPGLVMPEKVVVKALKDVKKGKDMSVCTPYVKYMHILAKIVPQKTIMKAWMRSIKMYLN